MLNEDQAHAVLLVYESVQATTRPGPPPHNLSHRRRPLRPPFRRVESEGVGVTSSILPIFIPERARARSAD